MQTKTTEAARRYIQTPAGGWGETMQAWDALVSVAGSDDAANRATTRALLRYPQDAHSSRGEQIADAETDAKRDEVNRTRAAWGMGPLPASATV